MVKIRYYQELSKIKTIDQHLVHHVASFVTPFDFTSPFYDEVLEMDMLKKSVVDLWKIIQSGRWAAPISSWYSQHESNQLVNHLDLCYLIVIKVFTCFLGFFLQIGGNQQTKFGS